MKSDDGWLVWRLLASFHFFLVNSGSYVNAANLRIYGKKSSPGDRALIFVDAVSSKMGECNAHASVETTCFDLTRAQLERN